MTPAVFREVLARLGAVGAADVAWAEAIQPPSQPEDFALELIFVICNSGMKNTVARRIYNQVIDAVVAGEPAGSVFGHRGKCAAIERIWRDREQLLRDFLAARDQLGWLESLPWIGPITKYHAAKNFGLDVAKPDIHLQRLADRYGCTPQELCQGIAQQVGLRVATVDTVLWRACANGVLNARTGDLAP